MAIKTPIEISKIFRGRSSKNNDRSMAFITSKYCGKMLISQWKFICREIIYSS